jgi:hypothetical protein
MPLVLWTIGGILSSPTAAFISLEGFKVEAVTAVGSVANSINLEVVEEIILLSQKDC